jgi:hypothetical protein
VVLVGLLALMDGLVKMRVRVRLTAAHRKLQFHPSTP